MKIYKYKAVVFMISLLFTLSPLSAMAADESAFLLVCSSMGCKYPKRGKEDRSSHIAFKIEHGKKILKELKTYRAIDKERLRLTGEKELLNNRIKEWYDKERVEANKIADKQSKVIVNLKLENGDLKKKNDKLILDVAKYKGQRYQYLLMGCVIGAGIVIVGGVAVAVVMAVK